MTNYCAEIERQYNYCVAIEEPYDYAALVASGLYNSSRSNAGKVSIIAGSTYIAELISPRFSAIIKDATNIIRATTAKGIRDVDTRLLSQYLDPQEYHIPFIISNIAASFITGYMVSTFTVNKYHIIHGAVSSIAVTLPAIGVNPITTILVSETFETYTKRMVDGKAITYTDLLAITAYGFLSNSFSQAFDAAVEFALDDIIKCTDFIYDNAHEIWHDFTYMTA